VSQLVRGCAAWCGLIVAVDLWSICDAPVLAACRPTSALCECHHAIMYTENVFVGVKQKTILIRRRVTLLNISTAKMRVDLTDIRYVVRINLLYIAYLNTARVSKISSPCFRLDVFQHKS